MSQNNLEKSPPMTLLAPSSSKQTLLSKASSGSKPWVKSHILLAMQKTWNTIGQIVPLNYFVGVSITDWYQNISNVYISKWEGYAISRDGTHAKLAYHWYGSWTTLYNLFADSLLCFHLEGASSSSPHAAKAGGKTGFVPQRIYKLQSDWYHAVRQRYGLPLDSRNLQAKTDWEFFAAAVTSKSVRQEILQSMALWINETSTGMPGLFLCSLLYLTLWTSD